MQPALHGILILDKPPGLSSMQAVSRIKRALKVKKAGHTGTLDPMATGVLPICIGQATRIAQFLLASDKFYRATMKLGQSTDTDDKEGTVLEERDVPNDITLEQLEQIFDDYRGTISQRPPIYSALKVNGKRAYALAREGKEVVLQPREVTVHQLDIESFNGDDLVFSCRVSKGTYIRSLIRDIGEQLGTLAHMTALERTRVDTYTLSQALSLDAVKASPEDAKKTLIPLAKALSHLPALPSEEEDLRLISNGQIPYSFPPPKEDASGPHMILRTDGTLLALVEPKHNTWKLIRVFPPAQS